MRSVVGDRCASPGDSTPVTYTLRKVLCAFLRETDSQHIFQGEGAKGGRCFSHYMDELRVLVSNELVVKMACHRREHLRGSSSS